MQKNSKNLNKTRHYPNRGESDGFKQLNLFGDEKFNDEAETKTGMDIQKKLTKIWQEVLGIKKISWHDNFFEIGGGFPMIKDVYRRLKKIYPNVKIAELFSYPTIADLAL